MNTSKLPYFRTRIFIMAERRNIIDKSLAAKKLRRMALEIIEQNPGEKHIILAGIRESGSVVARCVQKLLEELSDVKIELIMISLDKKDPMEVTLNNTPEINGKLIIVIDDVANSGRTLLYALKPFLNFRPKKIQTLVLVGRSHNSFPVTTDYVGLSIATTYHEHISVEVEGDEVVGAYLN
jgi:pyrimidine operon attenuation protein/uracil phosphoribosyltransferase